ncbi:ABC transporter ATP-binding protein [Pseudoclavibacter chungangensis]|uniref:ABC transporter ATP-binding protein n=1 Tax=Pseudoclavibacter chungangensis TaxID=587635 RepID=A0A7J5BYM1_9MICO|nr:ABC transporter ATP-binding protein [Pseudoclavibacter chungangensis]KAB1659455.1 ABC transporter ATP-binding protein [Pseudoclavibacter chungangensis]NYJ67692.1 ATP-binding cassette subfamily B protein [Pseudoclavibacter chungangensis]
MLVRLLVRYLRPYWPQLVGVLVFQFLQALAALTLPRLNADIIDKGVQNADIPYIWTHGGIMLLVSFGQIAGSVIATYFAGRAAMQAGRDIRAGVFARVSEFSEREVSQFGPGSLITRNTNDVQQVQMLIMMGCTMLVSAPMLAIGGIIMALQQDVGLSWLILVSAPLMLVVVGFIVARMLPLFRSYQLKLDNVNRVLREQLTGIRVVRAFVREDIERARFETANADLTLVGRKVGELFVLMFPLAMLILNVTVVGVVWFGGIQVSEGSVQIGTLFAFMTYVMQILMGVVMASFMTIMIPRAAVCAERISEVLATDTSLTRPAKPVTEFPERGTVELREAGFTYPGAEHPVLRDVSFRAERGETVAIVGSTGAGKTTLVGLIPRLFDATTGSVLVDGVEVDQADPELLWQRIGLVPQRPFLFSGTVESNLRFGNEDATEDQMWRALEIAQAKDFVEAREGGLGSRIAQGGTNVSGGQRQRLAIARAIIREPEILVFDDSFSALDLTTDQALRHALWAQLPEVTKIVVAQRISTIIDADRIVVLEDGIAVGIGTHDELLESCETYREIVESQLGVEAN